MKVVEDDHFCTDKESVFRIWNNELHKLYNRPEALLQHFDEEFYLQKISDKERLENEMKQANHTSNMFLNDDIGIDEIEKVVQKTQCGKATGIDHIPTDVLK